jgi:hypothetical protein
MTTDYPTDQVPATPEYVLALLRTWHEDGLLDDEPTFDTPVRELARCLNDTILFWRELARSLTAHLGLDIPVADWKPVLSPMGSRTVRDVCEFVAARMGTRPAIRPWRHIAGECLPAGAFLTIRALLAREGVDPDEITPSAPVAPFVRSHPAWIRTLVLMSPLHVPPTFVIFRPWWMWLPAVWVLGPTAILSVLLGGILLILAVTTASLIVAAVAVGMVVAGIVGLRWADRLSQPTGVEFADPHTFRDLAYALAGQQPRRRIQPSS